MSAQRGFTFIELLVVTTILFVLAATVMPLAQVTVQRQREVELRRALREMRTALDKFRDAVEQGVIPSTELEPANEGYPPDLEKLVDGVAVLVTLVLSSIGGSLIGVLVIAIKRGGMKHALPYGTFLALGALAASLVGDRILAWYLGMYDF